MNKLTFVLPAMACLGMMLAACGSDNNDDDLGSGIFSDSPVGGLSYVSGQTTGVTNAEGQFSYEAGGSVTFSIGDITLGTTSGAKVITPVELVSGATDETHPSVTNIARFLQTLDDDATPSNGITITSNVMDLAVGKSMDFSLSIADFENNTNVQTIVAELTAATTAGARSLVSTEQAQAHFKNTLISFLVGNYTGTFSGGDTGSFSLTINSDGTLSGNGQGLDETFTFTGAVNSDGSAAAGNTSTGAEFVMQISRAGSIQGTWSNSIFGVDGTLSGQKN